MARFVSMSGLDLSFMHAPQQKKRGRPRKQPAKAMSAYQRQMDELKARAADIPSKRSSLPSPVVMTDIKPFRSPVDGTEISSRSILRAHESKHGIKQCGDFKPGELISKENKRVALSKADADPKGAKWE